ncbi:helix-turn-helix domain-containing protein [Pseudomonas quasicaspiana]
MGATTYEAEPAIAFEKAVRAARIARDISQEELATLAGIKRSHMGKIERGATHAYTGVDFAGIHRIERQCNQPDDCY